MPSTFNFQVEKNHVEQDNKGMTNHCCSEITVKTEKP